MDKDYEYHKIKAQLSILRDVSTEYPERNIDKIIRKMEIKICNIEKEKN